MPGAYNRAIFSQGARRQRRAHVRAEVIDGQIPSMLQKQGDQTVLNLKRLPFAFGDILHVGHGDKIRHDSLILITIERLEFHGNLVTICSVVVNRPWPKGILAITLNWTACLQ